MAYTIEDVAFCANCAGWIDGDGCISIRRGKHARSQFGFTHRLQVVFTQVCWLPLFDQWHERWGGSVKHYAPARKKSKGIFHWVLVANQAAEFLEDLLPYLAKKKRQAQIGIDLQLGMRVRYPGRYSRMPRSEWDRREALHREICRLNQNPQLASIR